MGVTESELHCNLRKMCRLTFLWHSSTEIQAHIYLTVLK